MNYTRRQKKAMEYAFPLAKQVLAKAVEKARKRSKADLMTCDIIDQELAILEYEEDMLLKVVEESMKG